MSMGGFVATPSAATQRIREFMHSGAHRAAAWISNVDVLDALPLRES